MFSSPVAPHLKTPAAAIVFRILQITRMTGNRGLHRVCRILIESGAPYTLTSAFILVADAFWERRMKSSAWNIVDNIAGPIV